MASDEKEEEMAARQDPRLYPLGRALRSTYDAENHDSLDPVVTGLMIDLSHIDPEAVARAKTPGRVSGAGSDAGPEAGLLARLIGLVTGGGRIN